MILTRLKLSLLFFTLLAPLSSWSFGEDSSNQLQQEIVPLKVIKTELSTPSLKPGGVAELRVHTKLLKNYRAYIDQFRLDVNEPKDVFFSELQITPQEKFTDPVTKKQKWGTSGNSTILTLVQLPSTIRAGTYHVKSTLTFQACTDEFCLFPQKIPVELELRITGGSGEMITKLINKSLWYTLLLIFLGGILTSFTPCIFPMIPITLAVIGTHGVGRKKSRGFFISLTYVLGIALTYSLLGVLAAKTGALFGSLLGHPVVVGIIGILFVLLGLSMYGFYEIKFPDKWANKLLSKNIDDGFLGAFISGLIAGIVASPCVGPVLVGILAYVAQTQDVLLGFLLLFTFALGLGVIFIVLGTFSQLLNKLPKSGPWMDRVKFTFGTTMIGMALYFVYPVAHSALFDGLIATALILIASFFGAFPKAQKLGQPSKAWQSIMVVVFIAGWVFALKAIAPKHLTGKLFPSSQTSLDYAKPEWHRYTEVLVMKAKAEGIPIIVDFKADWCLACKELELYTFSQPEILELGKQFIWLEFDATHPSEELNDLRKHYDIRGLPHVVIYDRHGKWRTDLTLNGFEKKEPFLERMQKALE